MFIEHFSPNLRRAENKICPCVTAFCELPLQHQNNLHVFFHSFHKQLLQKFGFFFDCYDFPVLDFALTRQSALTLNYYMNGRYFFFFGFRVFCVLR